MEFFKIICQDRSNATGLKKNPCVSNQETQQDLQAHLNQLEELISALMNLSEYVLCTAACISKIIHSTPTSKQGNEKDNKQDLSSPLTSDTYLTISMPMAH